MKEDINETQRAATLTLALPVRCEFFSHQSPRILRLQQSFEKVGSDESGVSSSSSLKHTISTSINEHKASIDHWDQKLCFETFVDNANLFELSFFASEFHKVEKRGRR
jgi:hypothetical protein